MKPTKIILHHSGGTDAEPMGDSSNYTVVMCNQDHKARFNFLSSLGWYVGYQYVIEKDGKVTQCRKDDEEGAHTIGQNKSSIGIMLCGNFDATHPSERQKSALQKLLKEKMAQWSIPKEEIYPHRKFAVKTCYGKNLSDTWGRDLVTPPLQKVINKINSIFMTDVSTGSARVYEVINKNTGNVYPVSHYEFGSDRSFGVHLQDGILITFAEGTYDNGEYLIRDVETQLAPDGVTKVVV